MCGHFAHAAITTGKTDPVLMHSADVGIDINFAQQGLLEDQGISLRVGDDIRAIALTLDFEELVHLVDGGGATFVRHQQVAGHTAIGIGLPNDKALKRDVFNVGLVP